MNLHNESTGFSVRMDKLFATSFLFMVLMMFSPVQSNGENPARAKTAGPAGDLAVIGHRGAAGLLPENTLAGFARALELGVDAIELDVHLSADGQVVVHHDFHLNPDIARAPDGGWIPAGKAPAISALSVPELKRYDVGRLRPHSAYARRYPDQAAADGQRIPTLSEVIALISGHPDRKTQVWIEIKTSPESPASANPPEPVADAVLKLVQQAGILDRTRVLSFDWRPLVHLQKGAPAIPTIYLSRMGPHMNTIRPGQPGTSPWTAGFDVDDHNGSIPRTVKAAGGACWSPYYKELTADSLNEAHALGLGVGVWTVDKQNDMVRLREMGVDAITTNRPDILLALLGRH